MGYHWMGKNYAKQRYAYWFVKKVWKLSQTIDRTKNNEVSIWRLDGCILSLLEKECHLESKN